jgi:hypothetical protein
MARVLSAEAEINEPYYEDHGSGQPVVLIHGYPLRALGSVGSGHSWVWPSRDQPRSGAASVCFSQPTVSQL